MQTQYLWKPRVCGYFKMVHCLNNGHNFHAIFSVHQRFSLCKSSELRCVSALIPTGHFSESWSTRCPNYSSSLFLRPLSFPAKITNCRIVSPPMFLHLWPIVPGMQFLNVCKKRDSESTWKGKEMYHWMPLQCNFHKVMALHFSVWNRPTIWVVIRWWRTVKVSFKYTDVSQLKLPSTGFRIASFYPLSLWSMHKHFIVFLNLDIPALYLEIHPNFWISVSSFTFHWGSEYFLLYYFRYFTENLK